MGFDTLVASADRAVLAAFGEPVLYAPSPPQPPAPPVAVSPVSLLGVFDQGFTVAEGDARAGVEARIPSVFLLLADLPCDPENDNPTITVRGVDYRVIERQIDDVGGIKLFLRTKT